MSKTFLDDDLVKLTSQIKNNDSYQRWAKTQKEEDSIEHISEGFQFLGYPYTTLSDLIKLFEIFIDKLYTEIEKNKEYALSQSLNKYEKFLRHSKERIKKSN